MLTEDPPDQTHERSPAVFFWCDATAYTATGAFPLGSWPAATPRLALRWLHSRAQDIADQLDTPAARPVRAWLHDEYEYERALHRLAQGRTYTFTAHEDATRYLLTAHPTR